MNLIIKKSFSLLFLITLSGFLVWMVFPSIVAAQDQVAVGATVPSKVSITNSHCEMSANETLADPVHHSVLLICYIFDNTHAPLANINVVVTSNRGAVDIIESVSGTNETGVDGIASFRINSWVPGDTTIQILVDQLVNMPDQKIKFLPLPFPSMVTVSVSIPWTRHKINIISPQPTPPLTPRQEEAKRIANVGTELTIPFWILGIIIGLFIFFLILVITNFLNLRKVKRMERKEIAMLKKINQAEQLDNLKNEITQNGLDQSQNQNINQANRQE